MRSMISLHNKHILDSNNTEHGCNWNNRDECPLQNECLTPRIVYRADVTNNKTDQHKYYYGISDTPFKERYENHKTSCRYRFVQVWWNSFWTMKKIAINCILFIAFWSFGVLWGWYFCTMLVSLVSKNLPGLNSMLSLMFGG